MTADVIYALAFPRRARLHREDTAIDVSPQNLKLVAALNRLGVSRLNPSSFSQYRQTTETSETVLLDLQLWKYTGSGLP